MTFNSLQYAAFLPVVLVLYWSLGHRAQNRLLLVVSYLFYSFWDWRFLALLLVSTSVDFLTGALLAQSEDDGPRRRILALSIVTNLGILGTFKYYGFFVDSAQRLLERVGLDVAPPLLQVALPVGISFYTFHGMSYTIDLYRRRIAPATSFVTFATFVAFFPQLVAGPIGRAELQLPQFERPRHRPDSDRALGAVTLILLGLFKKVAIADAVAPVAAAAFADPGERSWLVLVVGAYAFALQIYGDFSGYTDMARGSARLFGFELPPNFSQPYLSRSIAEFWRTWHISLSSWLRDYLYLPLGGSQGRSSRTYRNLLLVMLIGGLWHGAAWTFVVWGGLHGLWLVGHRAWVQRRRRTAVASPLPTLAGVATSEPPRIVSSPAPARTSRGWAGWGARLLTFHGVVALWVFFRAGTVGSAVRYLSGLATFQPGPGLDLDDGLVVAMAGLATFLLDVSQRRRPEDAVLSSRLPVVHGVALGAMLVAIVVFSGGTPVPFIYFQF